MAFADNLQALKSIDDIVKIEVFSGGKLLSTIPNMDGKRGSLQVYAHLIGNKSYGVIDASSARKGLVIFDEKTLEALETYGKHPNIDILLDVVEQDQSILVTVEYKK